MLSFLIVVFCVFNHVYGNTCEIRSDEDRTCTTACNKNCAEYLRVPTTGARKSDPACAAGETVQDCESIKDSKGISNRNECWNKMQWRDILWDAATADERATGTLTTTRSIPNFGRYWNAPCEIEKSSLAQIQSVSCRDDDYQGRGPALDRGGAAISFADPEASGGQRDYLYLIDGKFGKYCEPAPRRPREAKTNYRNQIFAAFTERATVARRERAVSAESAAFRGAGRGRGMGRAEHVRPPPPAARGHRVRPQPPAGRAPPAGVPGAGAPPPPPRPPAGGESTDGTAHEEYVDSLWEEVNQMEEDELRYERALDKLRRAQRSFDMATKLRKLHKKKLREYYH